MGAFFSTAGIAGGQETTVMTCMPFFAHMGMIFIFIILRGIYFICCI